MNIWKLSHGSSQGLFTKQQHEEYLSRNQVSVHSCTAPLGQSSTSQGDLFTCKERKHDIFYVCWGNNYINLIGIFTEEISHADETDPEWHYRNFIPLIYNEDKKPYSKIKKWWTPNNNSTFCEVPEWEQSLFEKYILKSFFNINLQTLENLYNDKIQELKMEENLQPYIELLTHCKNLVFTGAPGTGKTYLANQIAKKFAKVENIGFVQFHPSYDYTDFVEGLRPVKKEGKEIGFELKNGAFKEICIEAKNFPSNKYVFIIDEINRAEISKVFGELFFSIDPGYRGKNDPKDRDKIVKVKLQYSNLYTEDDDFYDGFYVPENVYIIATMNDIDRSVEPFDFAMKRRFTWHEITPEDTYDNMWKNQPWYDEAYDRMTNLNNAITDPQKLNFSSAYHIGPSYFLKLTKDKLNGNFEELWKYHLKPVLQEYVKGFSDSVKKLDILKDAYDLKVSSSKTPNNSNV